MAARQFKKSHLYMVYHYCALAQLYMLCYFAHFKRLFGIFILENMEDAKVAL